MAPLFGREVNTSINGILAAGIFMSNLIVFFEIAGPDGGQLRSFFKTIVPSVVIFILFKDPAGNLHGIIENGSFRG